MGNDGSHLSLRGRHLPPIVWAFVALQALGWAYALSKDTKLSHELAPLTLSIVVGLLWLAALVIWRQRWAWWLWAIAYTIALISPTWQKRPVGISYAFDVLTLGLLLSPPMRRYLGIRRRQPTTKHA